MMHPGLHVALLLIGTATCPLAAAAPQGLWRTSVDSLGREGDRRSQAPSISGDGRFVVFESLAGNLVAGDTNQVKDVFLHDRRTGTTSLISVGINGAPANRECWGASVSDNGRLVAFVSKATNLVPQDRTAQRDVFVFRRLKGRMSRVSVSTSGAAPNRDCAGAVISGDGKVVAFETDATNLVPNDTNNNWDVFVHDRTTKTTTRVSVSSNGAEGNGGSYGASLSRDGRYVAFFSWADNLVPGDGNQAADVFLHDRATGVTSLVSVNSQGGQADGFSVWPSISGDGRWVAFESASSNLAPNTNRMSHVYLRDLLLGTTVILDVDPNGAPGNSGASAPSVDDAGQRVAFHSLAYNLAHGDTNLCEDVFVCTVRTRAIERISVNQAGRGGDLQSVWPALSGDGRFVAFESSAHNLVRRDENGAEDVFVAGGSLTLELRPDPAPALGPFTLTLWGGRPDGPLLMAVVDVNGQPTFVPLRRGRFDLRGEATLSGVVHPSLSGLALTFLGLGGTPLGTLEASNPLAVVFP